MQLITPKNKFRSRFAPVAIVALIALIGLGGCSSTPETPAPVTDGTSATSSANPGASTAGLGAGTGGTAAPVTSAGTVGSAASSGGLDPALTDPNNPLSKRSIFYDYDSFSVKDEYKPLVNAHAAYLKRNPNMRIVIEGNTDERGSREYNLALGQKRSEGARRVFTLLGVSESQIQTVSFGEEKPRNTASSEAAFAENRRCDIRYVGE
jgi:peptidoglycan-associated lipoprotein